MVGRNRTCPRVDHEEYCIGLFDCRFSLNTHAAGKTFRCRLLEARRIDDRKGNIAEPPLAFAAVASYARAVIDQSQAPADEAIE